jgi:hypothetical protein
MNDTVKTPTLKAFREAGYEVDIVHRRAWKVAYNDFPTKKIVVKTVLNTLSVMYRPEDKDENGVLYELLPRGGKTEVTVNDPGSGLDFTASAICRDDENYDKRVGVQRCLDRIIGLMLVCEYQDKSFKVRVGT